MEDVRARIVIYKGQTLVKSKYFYVEDKEDAIQQFFEMLEEVIYSLYGTYFSLMH
ncbi:unnamed protein product [marine sediment metagenome]|uniref:Uncharacterized protein n=1 Tax=marine sediment metagenome TaxID=412755 RepID=X1K8T3_9ZZZZ